MSINTTTKNGKLFNEKGEVAVIYSSGYGLGWNDQNQFDPDDVLFCPELAKVILEIEEAENNDDDKLGIELIDKASKIVSDNFPGRKFCSKLRVSWFNYKEGFPVIYEHSGCETVEFARRFS